MCFFFFTHTRAPSQVLRFGAHSPDVLRRLGWMRDVLGPLLDAAVRRVAGGVAVRPLLGASLAMGDEGHNRCKAATALLISELAPHLVRAGAASAAAGGGGATAAAEHVAEALSFLGGNAHFFLNLSMAASKLALDAAAAAPGGGADPACTVVTAMARNGVEFGVRLAAAPAEWFVAPTPEVAQAVWFPGYGPADACRDLGDSAITETLGLGGPSMAAAPALMSFVGGAAADAVAFTAEAREIYLADASRVWDELRVPALEWAGVPMLLDARRVVARRVRPAINTGIAHREAGVGQVGAGVSRAPLEPFEAAVLHVAAALGSP